MWTRIKYDRKEKKWIIKDYEPGELKQALLDLIAEDEKEEEECQPQN